MNEKPGVYVILVDRMIVSDKTEGSRSFILKDKAFLTKVGAIREMVRFLKINGINDYKTISETEIRYSRTFTRNADTKHPTVESHFDHLKVCKLNYE